MSATDRQLLEMAAKAAAYEVTSSGNDFWLSEDGIPLKHWNPLADDGDALRLAIGLKIHVGFVGEQPYANQSGASEISDRYAATRRAIVRAAGAIGEKMK